MVVCATTLSLLLVFLFGFVVNLSLAHNHVYHVGEHDGWTLLPLGKYNHWAQKHRFQVNDDLGKSPLFFFFNLICGHQQDILVKL